MVDNHSFDDPKNNDKIGLLWFIFISTDEGGGGGILSEYPYLLT